MEHTSPEDLEAGLEVVTAAPTNSSPLAMIVIRPDVDKRELPDSAKLQPQVGVVGDNYASRGSSRTPDGAAHPEAEVTIMNTRVLDLITGGDRSRWPEAGDQLLVDMDLSFENMPTGTRLAVGTTELEITAKPHTGCHKFTDRFGPAATRWVTKNADLRLRGVNARVVKAGSCAVGDLVSKVE